METKITIALADDELLFRQGVIAILNKNKNLNILFDADHIYNKRFTKVTS